MNILSSEQMKAKEAQLLQLYHQSDLKFKFSLDQLLQAKHSRRSLFCFRKAQTKTDVWIQKLVPLHKRVQLLNLQQQQNGIFKVIVFVFLLMIYKPKQSLNHYVLQHLKCSLFSDDIDLLEIKNHSFNKKMKSDTIKSVIATFFSQIQHLIEHQIKNQPIIKVEDLLAYALQKNDMIVQGFHLFYRSILTKFDVQGANNCISQVNPQQVIQNLIQYFQIDCRIFNDLYLFSQSGIFLARIQSNMMFGRYYQNELYYQETSQQQVQPMPKLSFSQQHGSQNMFLPKNQDIIEKNDVKIFNFLLDTDRNSDQNFIGDKSQQITTPCFQHNDDIKFGKKTDRDLDTSFSKLKNRIQNQKINQISSQEEQIQLKHNENILGDHFGSNKFSPENKFLNLGGSDDDDFSDTDAAPTPMLGGGQVFGFGKKGLDSFVGGKTEENVKKSSHQSKSKKNQNPLIQTKQIKTSAVRRQSYQGDNSSQSKSSQKLKKAQMKTSKNQIKVMDGTSSQVNLGKFHQSPLNIITDQFKYDRKQNNFMQCQKVSSYSNCTCHLEKRNRIKLSSQIMAVSVSVSNTPKSIHEKLNFEDPSRKVSTELFEPTIKKEGNQESRKFLFKGASNKSTQNLKLEKKTKSPVNKDQKDQVKSPEFLSFLRKDKSELIKKLTQKRIAKQNVTGGQIVSQKNLADAQHKKTGQKRYVKQSMFVGSYNFQNPQRINQKAQQHNRSITPNSSIDKHQRNDQRSRTPTQQTNAKTQSSQGMKLFKVNNVKENTRQVYEGSNYANYRPPGVPMTFNSQPGSHAMLNMTTQKQPITIKYHQNTTGINYVNKVPTVGLVGQQKPVTTQSGTAGYEFYFKR